MAIQVEFVEARGQTFWPGRIFAAARGRACAPFATAIDDAFARWDRAHLMRFEFADGARLERPDRDPGSDAGYARKVRLSRLSLGEHFAYEFDFADSWTHLRTVGPRPRPGGPPPAAPLVGTAHPGVTVRSGLATRPATTGVGG